MDNMSHSQETAVITTAIAIDKDKNSHYAVKWASESLLKKNSEVVLVHVRTQSLQSQDVVVPKEGRTPTEAELQQFFLPFRGFCARKGIRAKELVLHDLDVGSALVEFISNNLLNNIVVGASSRSTLMRAFRNADVATNLVKNAPDFCSVYVVAKGKVQNSRLASRPAVTPTTASSHSWQAPSLSSDSLGSWRSSEGGGGERLSFDRNYDFMETPLAIGSRAARACRIPSPQILGTKNNSCNNNNLRTPNQSNQPPPHHQDSSSESGGFSGPPSFQSSDFSFENIDSQFSDMNSRASFSSQTTGEVEDEMRRLKLELKQTMEMYNSACREAVNAKEKAREMDDWKSMESRKLEEAQQAQETALAMVEIEKQKCKAAVEAAQMAQRLAELESQKRKRAERRAKVEHEERQRAVEALARSDIRYRKYSIGEIENATDHFAASLKIGDGGYGNVYKANLDHTAVAIKVLRSDISQGQKQFQREIEVLSCMRHPNMVLLLGACPEYGCLVYEYMENGSLEDRLFRRNSTPSLSWTIRFKIAAEIATALLFLHQTKPEPLVHRDLKPANILLDGNYVSKISDVGLSRLVPSSVAGNVTQYRMTAAAGTFCYIDPEYQQTGMLGTKSDIYSVGVVLLQILTGKPPMGLTHQVEKAIEKGTLSEILDPTVPNWPADEALAFAKLALMCCELRRKDRPDLGSVILPELERLRDFGLNNNNNRDKGEHFHGDGSTYSSFETSSCRSRDQWSSNPDMQQRTASASASSSTISGNSSITLKKLIG